MPTTENKRGRKRQDPEPMRNHILESMIQIVSEYGYERTNLQAVADDAGIAKGTLYLYFKSKEELFSSAVKYAIDQLGVKIDEEVQRQHSPRLKIRAVILAFLEFIETRKMLSRVIVHEAAQFQTQADVSYFHLYRKNAHNMHQILKEGMESGAFRVQDPVQLAESIVYMLTGAMYTSIYDEEGGTLLENAPSIIDFVFNGIMA